MYITLQWTQKYPFRRKLNKLHVNRIPSGTLFLKEPDCNTIMGGNLLLPCLVFMQTQNVHISFFNTDKYFPSQVQSPYWEEKEKQQTLASAQPWPLWGGPEKLSLTTVSFVNRRWKKWFPVELEVARDNLSQWGKITIVIGLNKMAQHGRLAEPGSSWLQFTLFFRKL